MRHIGIDYGSKRVGIAISDEAGEFAFPYRVLKNDHLLVKEVVALVEKEGVDTIVVGESRDLEGAENPIMKTARNFIDQLERHTGKEVKLASEIYTTQAAKRGEPGEKLDASAAALILQGYLDQKKGRAAGRE